MVCVTPKMRFARAVADRVIVIDRGRIAEEDKPNRFFTNPQHERPSYSSAKCCDFRRRGSFLGTIT